MQLGRYVRINSSVLTKVIVKHVYINGNAVVGDGAQALFGNVQEGAEQERRAAAKLPG